MIPERYAPATYALFRIVFGFIFLIFGLQKFGLLQGQAAPLASLQGAAGVIEAVTGLLIMIGLFTRPAAFIASGEMAVAFFYIHVLTIGMGGKNLAMPHALVPQWNNGVDAALFSVAFLYICSRGAGILSLDGAKGGRGGRR
jgi:putative oxidoreductase